MAINRVVDYLHPTSIASGEDKRHFKRGDMGLVRLRRVTFVGQKEDRLVWEGKEVLRQILGAQDSSGVKPGLRRGGRDYKLLAYTIRTFEISRFFGSSDSFH